MTTIRIPLTQGKFTLVDEEDYPLVAPFTWTASKVPNSDLYYAYMHVNDGVGRYRRVAMHRFILDAAPADEVDHINGNGLDNRRSVNLRHSIRASNAKNRRKNRVGTSQYKGVCWRARRGKWEATIACDNTDYFLGRFATEEEAARAYDAKAKELHGVFAHLNFPDFDESIVPPARPTL